MEAQEQVQYIYYQVHTVSSWTKRHHFLAITIYISVYHILILSNISCSTYLLQVGPHFRWKACESIPSQSQLFHPRNLPQPDNFKLK